MSSPISGLILSGKQPHSELENHHVFLMGKSTISMTMFKFANCWSLPEGVNITHSLWFFITHENSMVIFQLVYCIYHGLLIITMTIVLVKYGLNSMTMFHSYGIYHD